MELDRNSPTELRQDEKFCKKLGSNSLEVVPGSLPPVKDSCAQFGLAEDYFIIFAGTSDSKKQWGVSNFAAVATKIQEVTRWLIVLCGAAIGNASIELMRMPHSLVSLTS